MERDSDKAYTMPLLAGPLFPKGQPIPYPDVEGVLVQYETTREAIAALLPDCYEPAEEPLVNVMFGYYKGLSFLAGGDYNIATVQVRARFDGRQDHVDADYPTITENDISLEELWLGKSATIYFSSLNEEDVSWIARVIEALKTLSLLRIARTARYQGSAVLRYDKSRQLV